MSSINPVVETSSSGSSQSVVSHGVPSFGAELGKITHRHELSTTDEEKTSTSDLEQHLQNENQALETETMISRTSELRNVKSAEILEKKIQKIDNLEQLQTDNQALRIENQLLKDQLRTALECVGDLYLQVRVLNKEKVGVTSPQAAEETTHSLPPEILLQIFDNITDTKTLLAARAVCRSWKTLIDDSPSLMRRITFLVLHPRLFLHLTNIVPRVRSISFVNILPGPKEDLQNLISVIAPTLESVVFDFDLRLPRNSATKDEREHMVCSVLRQCPKLNELHLLGAQNDFMRAMDFNEPMFANITSLTINALDVKGNLCSILDELILSLSRLSNLALFCHLAVQRSGNRDYVPVLTPVYQHMVKYPGVLKKLVYGQDDLVHVYGPPSAVMWTELFLMAGKQGVVVTTAIPFDLHNLAEFEVTDEHQVNLKNCGAITQGRLSKFSPDSVNQHRLDLCVNLEELQVFLQVNDASTRDKLSILWRLKKLRKMTWRGSAGCGTISEQVFAGRLALGTVRNLTLEDDAFDSTGIFFSSLYLYFPNLVHLRLCRTTVPQDLFVSLKRIEGLETLELMSLPNLQDTDFLARKEDRTGIPFVRLAKLKALTICDCPNLTDYCLQNGILRNSTLQMLTLLGCPGISDVDGYEAITNGRLKKKRIAEQYQYSGYTFT